jgi:signal peptidase I
MTKHKSVGTQSPSASDAASQTANRRDDPSAEGLRRHLPSAASIREMIESVAIALVLAFLFRTFEAEAFVIPTGSMAPTLMGRHKDLVCPKCGFPYQVSASEEVDQDGAPNRMREADVRIEAGTCPMCRYTAPLGSNNPQHANYPSYNGDRILVGKFIYEFADPQRWDVIVFKYPGDAPTNFIKRLVGLPGETVRIQHGNIWVRGAKDAATSDGGFSIARKPPQKLLAMLQPVFDNDYLPQIAKYGWQARWYADPDGPAAENTAGAWTSDGQASFSIDGTAAGENWLRYHHLIPSYDQWAAVEHGSPLGSIQLKPQLITDFTAYDTRRRMGANLAPDGDALGVNWVGDLAMECTAKTESPNGELILELRKGGRRFQCRFDLASGRATLSISGQDMQQWHPSAITKVRGVGRHDIRFSNCDDELLLWVDGHVVSFDAPTTYQHLKNTQPDNDDLAPVGVASAGAQVKIGHLRVFRDIYYGAVRGDGAPSEVCDVHYEPGHALPNRPIWVPQSQDHVDFPLKADQFFVLGDNSACSKDGRLWGSEYWVNRELLIGKAEFIYWPHSWDKLPYVGLPCPYFPNVRRMGLVR